MQMPYYIKCFQSPSFISGPLSGGCEALHEVRTSSLVHPTDVFRQQATVQIDVSPCAFYLNSTAVGGADNAPGMDLMQPFEIKLRPNSTDHDVFLQACLSQHRSRPAPRSPQTCFHSQWSEPMIAAVHMLGI